MSRALNDVNEANQIKTVEIHTILKRNTVIDSQRSDKGREVIAIKSKEQVVKQEYRKGTRNNSSGSRERRPRKL